MIFIRTSRSCNKEKEYIFSIVFSEFLGIDYSVHFDLSVADETIISVDSQITALIVKDEFFQNASANWLTHDSLPKLPLTVFEKQKCHIGLTLPFSKLPVLFGSPSIKKINDHDVFCGIDLFGSIFFMLSRYEELVIRDRDEHNRFSAKSSVAYQGGFLMRPIVNEYVELLWQILCYLDPSLTRRKRTFRTTLTCDVDWPFNPLNQDFRQLIKSVLSNIIRSHNFRRGIRSVKEFFRVRKLGWQADSHNTFDYLMNLAEKNNIGMVFYFICDHSGGTIDGNYDLNDPRIENLMKQIHRRNHEIGLHTSYNTYLNQDQTNKEAGILVAKLNSLGLDKRNIGVRQHYLRYQTSETIRVLDSANLNYDSTLSYADYAGFRCGTCYEYTMYDLQNRKKLRIKERPLIAMETSVISTNYMNLGYTKEAIKVFSDLKKQCHLYGGHFILLWHNSFFHDEKSFAMLEEIVAS